MSLQNENVIELVHHRTVKAPITNVEQLLNIEEVANWLQLSRSQAYKMVKDGTIKSVRLGKLLRFNPSDIRELIQKGTA